MQTACADIIETCSKCSRQCVQVLIRFVYILHMNTLLSTAFKIQEYLIISIERNYFDMMCVNKNIQMHMKRTTDRHIMKGGT